MQRFARECRITAETRVLDIGGTPDNWQLIGVAPRLVLLNMPRARAEMAGDGHPVVSWVAGDGRSDWLKGAQLLTVYLVLALTYYFLPGSAPP